MRKYFLRGNRLSTSILRVFSEMLNRREGLMVAEILHYCGREIRAETEEKENGELQQRRLKTKKKKKKKKKVQNFCCA